MDRPLGSPRVLIAHCSLLMAKDELSTERALCILKAGIQTPASLRNTRDGRRRPLFE